jgi:hypothetical protein
MRTGAVSPGRAPVARLWRKRASYRHVDGHYVSLAWGVCVLSRTRRTARTCGSAVLDVVNAVDCFLHLRAGLLWTEVDVDLGELIDPAGRQGCGRRGKCGGRCTWETS